MPPFTKSKNAIELKVLFLEIVHPNLYSGKVWGFSIFSYCTPPCDIYGRLLLSNESLVKPSMTLDSWPVGVIGFRSSFVDLGGLTLGTK